MITDNERQHYRDIIQHLRGAAALCAMAGVFVGIAMGAGLVWILA